MFELNSAHIVHGTLWCASALYAIVELGLVSTIVDIPLPLPHIGSVNAWLLKGDPLTLVDTGPRDERALAVLEAGLRREGVRLEDVELVLGTHHHLDHVGLAATIQRRAGARVAVLDATAGYAERYEDRTAMDRRFSRALMAHHGVPAAVIADTEGFWDYLFESSERFDADLRLRDGDRIRAGGRELRVLSRPGHSTTDTLFVDDREAIAFVGDHLLARISSNTEIYPAAEPDGTRPRARIEYLANLRRTAGMPLRRLLTGHGRPVTGHARLIADRLEEHRGRCRRIEAILADGPRTAFAIAAGLWAETTLAEQPLFVVWEVLGHVDLLIDAGMAAERIGDDGQARFELTRR
jgi:glyoxylase-like metal-dependent hydrolase (beta-lactamase superfamily II)